MFQTGSITDVDMFSNHSQTLEERLGGGSGAMSSIMSSSTLSCMLS